MACPDLTFGIELETILVYHESLLKPHIPPGTKIVKDITLGARDDSEVTKWMFQDGRSRRYDITTEPSKIAAELVRNSVDTEDPLADIQVTTQDIGNKKEYESWKVMQERAVPDLDAYTKEDLLEEHEPDEWTSQAIEFVSPVYWYTDDLEEVLTDVKAIREHVTTQGSFLHYPENCGLHVHVGSPDGARFPREVVRALAFLTIVYEDEISKVHAVHRVGQKSRIASNRKYWVNPKLYPKGTVLPAYMRTPRQHYAEIKQIREDIFHKTGDIEDDYMRIQELLGDGREHIINWQYIYGFRKRRGYDRDEYIPGPATVEFRQHETVERNAPIKHWIRFCVALVGLAYEMASQEADCLPKIQTWDSEEIHWSYLFMRMKLPLETVDYYINRCEWADDVEEQREAAAKANRDKGWEFEDVELKVTNLDGKELTLIYAGDYDGDKEADEREMEQEDKEMEDEDDGHGEGLTPWRPRPKPHFR